MGGYDERKSTRQTVDRQAQIAGGDQYSQGQNHAG